MTLDAHLIYSAGRDFGLRPVASEVYGAPTTNIKYFVVAVAKKGGTFTLNDLQVIKICLKKESPKMFNK